MSQISRFMKSQIDDYKKQIEQLHTIILATQKDNQLQLSRRQRDGGSSGSKGFRFAKFKRTKENAQAFIKRNI